MKSILSKIGGALVAAWLVAMVIGGIFDKGDREIRPLGLYGAWDALSQQGLGSKFCVARTELPRKTILSIAYFAVDHTTKLYINKDFLGDTDVRAQPSGHVWAG